MKWFFIYMIPYLTLSIPCMPWALELAGQPPWATHGPLQWEGVSQGASWSARGLSSCDGALHLYPSVAVGLTALSHQPRGPISRVWACSGAHSRLSVCRALGTVKHNHRATTGATWNSFPETMETPSFWSIFATLETLYHFVQQFVFAVAGNSLLQGHIGRSSLVPRVGSDLQSQVLASEKIK